MFIPHVQEVAIPARLSGCISVNPGINHGIKISTSTSSYKPKFLPPLSLGQPALLSHLDLGSLAFSKQVMGGENGTVELAKCLPVSLLAEGFAVTFKPKFSGCLETHLCFQQSQTEFSIPRLQPQGKSSQPWRLGASCW